LSEKKKIDTYYEHALVPEHVLLNKEEIDDLLKKYRINPYQLPHIKLSDPPVRELKAKLGDIIKIIRNSQTAGEAIAYRYVVKG